jgi:hypothetical protein
MAVPDQRLHRNRQDPSPELAAGRVQSKIDAALRGIGFIFSCPKSARMNNIDHGPCCRNRPSWFRASFLSSVRNWTQVFLRLKLAAVAAFSREAEMEKFVHRENLKLYRKLLAETTDEQKRQTLLKLLAEEEARDAQPAEKKQS